MTTPRLILSAALIASVGLAGCGRRSDLDTPYEAAVQARRDAQKAGEPLPPEPKKPVEDKPFFLDKLIQ